ncbi:60S ribosomal protein L10 [Bienertia sinuspersici]
MLPCAGANRLQIGMRGAFGKSKGTCVRVAIGQVLLSVHCKDLTATMLRRLSIVLSSSFPVVKRSLLARSGFTKYNCADYVKYKSENRIVSDGVNAKA